MAKQQSNLRLIFKINSSKIRKAKWDFKIKLTDAKKNGELVALADSTTLRLIRKINEEFNETVYSKKHKRNCATEWEINELKRRIKKVRRTGEDIQNLTLKELYKELDKKLYVPEYVCIVMDKNSDYDKLNKGFKINGIKYRRLLATTNGVKNSTIVYAADYLRDELYKRLNCGRKEDIELVPAKFEAYLSLACSASIPVTNTNKIIVVNDCVTNFKTTVTMIDDTQGEFPVVKTVEDYEVNFESSDGQGLIMPHMMEKWSKDLKLDYLPSGVCIRNAFCKGMLFTFDFQEFCRTYKDTSTVKDVWGNEHDLMDVDMILTTSMLKLWKAYDNLEDYLTKCEENGFGFSVTKIPPKKLEDVRRLNYQFIQCLNLDDDDIDELIKPTVDKLKGVLLDNYENALAYLGSNSLVKKIENMELEEEDYILAALMANPESFNDIYIKNRILTQVKKKIDEAKFGRLDIDGNFAIIADDPITLMHSVLDMPVKGLLKAGEFYHKHWINKGVFTVAGFRAPMTDKSNARILNIKNEEDMQHWYKYMDTVCIFNSWDMTCSALNGADKDSDTVMTTNNKPIIDGIEELNAIVCVQKNAQKKRFTEDDFIASNKASFGNEIGSITNRITSMYELQSKFEKGSREYEELDYRIKCGQNFQQNSIDKAKGIVSKPMPKEWYEIRCHKIEEDDDEDTIKEKEFQRSICAYRKPYFMNYIYKDQMKEYKEFINKYKREVGFDSRKTIDDLFLQEYETLTDSEKRLLDDYIKYMPVGTELCIMNLICNKIENSFTKIISEYRDNKNFDYTIYMSKDIEPMDIMVKDVLKLFRKYNLDVRNFMAAQEYMGRTEELSGYLRFKIFLEEFKRSSMEICYTEETLCNVLVMLAYRDGRISKKFVWHMVGDIIIENLLNNNNSIIHYMELNEDGNLLFNGNKYELVSKEVLFICNL